MIIAIPTNDRTNVEAHFGHCKEFALFNSSMQKTDFVVPPPHQPGVLPEFLAEQGADTILCGGMGKMAVDLFAGNKIDVILGVQGPIETAIQSYLAGELVSRGSVCDHSHH